MANMKQVPGKPGQFKVTTAEGAKIVKLVEWREDYIYDTIEMVATIGAAAANEWMFFVSTSGPAGAPKTKADTNLRTPRRLSSGQEMILNQIGVTPLHNRINSVEISNIDFAWVLERLSYKFEINQIPMAEGPVGFFPPGWGGTGVATIGGAVGFMTNGVASPAAVPRLLVPQNIYVENDISGTLTHSNVAWTTTAYVAPTIPAGGLLVRNSLRGYIKTAVGKG